MLRQRHIVLLLIALLSVSIVFAQEDDSTQTYLAYDGWLTFDYPASWVIDREGDDFGAGLLTIANSQGALDAMRRNSEQESDNPVPAGDVAIIIARPEFLFGLTSGFDPSVPLMDILTGFMTTPTDMDITVEETTIAGYPALRMDSADETSAGIILAIQFEPGFNFLLAASTSPNELPQYEETIMAIAESVQFGGLAEAVLLHEHRLWGAEWSADGSLFLTRDLDFAAGTEIVRMWDAETYQLLFRVEGNGAAFSPDGTMIVVPVSGYPTLILDAQTGDLIVEIGEAHRAVWNGDGTKILTSNFDAALVAVWDAETGERLLGIDYQTSLTPAWALDDTVIVTGVLDENSIASFVDDPREVIHWDAETGARLLTVPDTLTITLNSDNTRMLYADSEANLVQAEYPSGVEIWRRPIERGDQFTFNVIAPRWNANRTRIFGNFGSCPPTTTNCHLSGYVWDAETGEVVFSTSADETYRAGVYLENGQIAGGLRGLDTIKVWDSNTGEVVAELPTASFVYRMYFSPERQQMFAFEDTGIVRIYAVETWEQVMALPHDDQVESGLVSADNPDRFITVTEDGTYTIWDLTTGRELLHIGHANREEPDVVVYNFPSPDGEKLLTFVLGSVGARVFRQDELITRRLAEYAAEPYTAEELDEMGIEAGNNRDYDEAIQWFSEAVRVDPDAVYALNGRALAYYRLGDVQAAMGDINRAIVLDPTYVEAIKRQGDVWRLQGNNDRAIESYNRALELDPEDPTLYNVRGVAYANLTDYPAAIDDFDAAIALDPTYAQPYSNRAFVYSYMDRNEEALESLEVYLELIGGEVNASEEVIELLNNLRETAN